MDERNVPSSKVAAVGVSGAATLVVVWVLGLMGVPVTPEIAAAIVVVVGAIAGYVKREKRPTA